MLLDLLESLGCGLEAADHRLAGGLHLQQAGVVAGGAGGVPRPRHWQALNVLAQPLLSLVNLLQLITDGAENVNGSERKTEVCPSSCCSVLLRPRVVEDAVSQSVHPDLSLSGTAGSHLIQHNNEARNTNIMETSTSKTQK